MMFNREAEMAPSVAEWLKQESLLVKLECTTPFGICDLVGVAFRRDRVVCRLRLGQTRPIASLIRSGILRLIPDIETGRSISVDRLQKAFAGLMPKELVASEVSRLVSDKFVMRRGRTYLQKLNGWIPLHSRMVAVELKLTRVEEALAQARAHLTFADESYIGLPVDVAERVIAVAHRWQQYWDLGIGLLAVAKGSCRIVRQSRSLPAAKDQSLQMYMADKFWRNRSQAVHH